jgi:hypothetical protein
MRIMTSIKFNNGEIQNYFEVENFKMSADCKLASFSCKDINTDNMNTYKKNVFINVNNVFSIEHCDMDEV